MNALNLLLLGLSLSLVACLPESVKSVTLTPESPEMEAVLRAADARWEAAGVDPDRIKIGPGGAPVRLVTERCGGISEDLCIAETRTHMQGTAFRGVRWMELYSLDVDLATHEMGHALGIEFHLDDETHDGDPACNPDLPVRPTMCSHVGNVIASADLDRACSSGECEHFTPEAN